MHVYMCIYTLSTFIHIAIAIIIIIVVSIFYYTLQYTYY